MKKKKPSSPKHRRPRAKSRFADQAPKIRITKLEAAERQLDCAIALWFRNEDAVSIHTLVCAAHQIVHDVLKSRYPTGLSPDLLFNSLVIRDEGQAAWEKLLKRAQNFFKHADRDPEGITEFLPFESELIIFYALKGLGLLGRSCSSAGLAFAAWHAYHHPEMLGAKGRKIFLKPRAAAELAKLKSIPKAAFLDAFQKTPGKKSATL